LLDLPLVSHELSQPRVHILFQGDAVPGGPLPDQDQGILKSLGHVERRERQVHPTGLDLRQIQDVVDQGEEVLTGREDVPEVLGLLLVHLAEQAVQEHLGEADDGVEGGPQLVGHVGQEHSDLCWLAASSWRLLSSIS
jgi:hypothetical protein